jgi:hypothetical protein
MRTLLALVAATALLAVGAAPALADDNSVYQAYISRDADFSRAGKEVRRGVRIVEQSNGRRTGPLQRALRKTRNLCTELIEVVEAEESSSDAGRRAKEAAIESIRLLRQSTVALSRGVTAAKRGQRRRAARLARQAERLADRSIAATRRARRAFREAGVDLK